MSDNLWSNVKNALGSTLPAIASALGTPLAGNAVKVLCNALGLKDGARPDEILSAFQNATPEQIIRLQEIDSNERIRMEEVAAGDRNSARIREVESKKTGDSEWIMKFIVVATFAIFCLLTLLPFFTKQDAFDTEIIKNSLEIVKGMLWLEIGYYFGSSVSSRQKDATISKLTPNNG